MEDPDALQVLHEDEQLLAVFKPAGLLVHRSALDAQADDDVVTRLRRQRDTAVWPAHRLDKGTSGVLLLAKDAVTARALGQAFADGMVHKQYLALVRGWPQEQGSIDYPLARDPELPSTGQPLLEALTHWQVLQRFDWPVQTQARHPGTRCALVLVWPMSGRRHQIRRHFKQLAHPLIGDATHGKGPLNRVLAAHIGCQRLWLHACTLRLIQPTTGHALQISAQPGAEWAALLPADWQMSLREAAPPAAERSTVVPPLAAPAGALQPKRSA